MKTKMKMKVSDTVTQSELFPLFWNAPKFKRKITYIENDIIYLNKPVKIKTLSNNIMNIDSFHIDYLIIDIKELRKQKLQKLKII